MNVMLAWFADRPLPVDVRERLRAGFDAEMAGLVSSGYVRRECGAEHWGLLVSHQEKSGGYRWPTFANDGPLTTVSVGLPVGLDVPTGPIGLARRLLRGEDVHAGVVPPFALLAVDEHRFCLQQDWLGMCRVFTATHDGVTVFATRPSMLSRVLFGTVAPDEAGWTSYAVCGHFGGLSSPVRDVRLLGPGERVTGECRGDGWRMVAAQRYGMDDVVTAWADSDRGGEEAALDSAAESLRRTAGSIGELYEDKITLGLSGGKDSRLIAASLVAAGQLPRLVTNEDMALEGEAARRLVEILRDKRGLEPPHRLVRTGAPGAVLPVGLRERVQRMQRTFDFQFPSTYAVRPAVPERFPASPRAASLTGAGGELAVGYWYPSAEKAGDDRATAESAAARHLLSSLAPQESADGVRERERERLTALLDHAETLGLRGLALVDYVYLAERVRRWSASAYYLGMVTPFLSPGFVSASFALDVEQKRRWALHKGLLARLLPEWGEVPFVSAGAGPSTAVRIWEGDGSRVLTELLDAAGTGLVRLMRTDVIERSVARAAAGTAKGSDERVLRQFAMLAVGSYALEPDIARREPGVGRSVVAAEVARQAGRRTGSSLAPRRLMQAVVRRLRRRNLIRSVGRAGRAVLHWLPDIRGRQRDHPDQGRASENRRPR